MNTIEKTYQMTKETAEKETTEELGKIFIYAKDEVAYSKQCLATALNTWTSDWKVENAKKVLKKITDIKSIVTAELVGRGAKSVKNNGAVVF
jgi:hypothetical protein